LQQEELRRFAKKEKMHSLTAMKFLSKEEQAKAQRDLNMDNEEHNVAMLNISIQEENVKNDRLAEERCWLSRFCASWDQNSLSGAAWGKSRRQRWKRC
jgi:hypothetical protein